MKIFFNILTVFFIFWITACSSDEHDINKTEAETTQKNEQASNISVEDKAIIKKYKDTINNLNFRVREDANKVMKESLSEISKIKNDDERQKIEMQIYMATEMYKEAYDLNKKMLSESFSFGRLVTKCELSYYAKISKQEAKACYTELAVILQKELETTPKNDPKYIYGEWSYLLFMYKSGHDEYKQKMENFINSTKDETAKYQFQSSYEMAIEQNK